MTCFPVCCNLISKCLYKRNDIVRVTSYYKLINEEISIKDNQEILNKFKRWKCIIVRLQDPNRTVYNPHFSCLRRISSTPEPERILLNSTSFSSDIRFLVYFSLNFPPRVHPTGFGMLSKEWIECARVLGRIYL